MLPPKVSDCQKKLQLTAEIWLQVTILIDVIMGK